MYHTNFLGFEGAVPGSVYVRKFQSALAAVGYSPSGTVGGSGGIDGTWGPYTRVAMNKYQAANGHQVTEFPSIETMAKLGIPPANWPQTVSDAGGYAALVTAATKAAADYATPAVPEEPPPVVTPSGNGLPVVAPAPITTSMVGVWPWFKRNWKWFAIGGGIGAVGLTGILLMTRKSAPAYGDVHTPKKLHEMFAKDFTRLASAALRKGDRKNARYFRGRLRREQNMIRWHQERGRY